MYKDTNSYLADRITELEDTVDKQTKYFDYITQKINELNDIIANRKFSTEYLNGIDIKMLETYMRNRKIQKINEV